MMAGGGLNCKSATFVTGNDLSEAVTRVLAGGDVGCAVAFWGIGSRGFLDSTGARSGQFRIVCDTSMGGTHPEALRSLGAPGDPSVRYHDGLHAKVYVSEVGVVVGSANASDNGIGFGNGEPGLTEAGTFHEAGSDVWESARAWFDRLHSKASIVDDAAIERARRRFRPRSGPRNDRHTRPGSLVDMVLAHPERFDGIGFVVVSASSTPEERETARRSAKKAGIERSIVEDTRDNDMFVEWNTEDVLRWPVSFIELWMPKGRLHLYARTVRALDPTAGNVFTKKDARALRKLLPADCPSLRVAEKMDGEVVRRLLAGDEGLVFRTATEFAAAIETAIAG
jgi:hypothetical protein